MSADVIHLQDSMKGPSSLLCFMVVCDDCNTSWRRFLSRCVRGLIVYYFQKFKDVSFPYQKKKYRLYSHIVLDKRTPAMFVFVDSI